MVLSFFNVKCMVLLGCALASLTFANQEQKEICGTGLIINETSGSSEDGEGNGNIHKRSLSSWTWKANLSHDRIPEMIIEAQCNSEYCNLPSGMDGTLNSVPIYQDILVLKRTNHKRCFRATFETVVVGCTCVRAKTSLND